MAIKQVNPQGKTPVPSNGEGQAILSLQSRLAITAKRAREHRFDGLYSLLWRQEWLSKALDAVLDNSGSETPGVDGKRGGSLQDPSKRAKFLENLSLELRQRRYRPSPVLRKYVPKSGGGQRPIGIPTIKDRVVQTVLKMVLEPIFEADFLPNSNGFRPGRSTLECILPLYRYGNSKARYDWVIEGDIKGCFDNIDHRILMDAIQQRIADRRVLRLVLAFLKAPVVEHGVRTKMGRGTPQGGVLSPLLANIYLNRFDQYWFEKWGKLSAYERRQWRKHGKASCELLRYADDFILAVKGSKNQAISIVNEIREFFEDQLKLELTAEKTRVVSLKEGFEFLGFQIQRHRLGHFSCVRICPTSRNVASIKLKLLRMLGRGAYADDPALKIKSLNLVLRGWANYYANVNSQQQFRAIDHSAELSLAAWLRNKRRISVRESFRQMKRGKQIALAGQYTSKELFCLSSLKSQRTSLNYRACWKYRSIPNPYLEEWSTSIDDGDNSLIDAREIHPTSDALYDETYRANRLLAFERDGWRCTGCGERVGLEAHHIRRVPRVVLDPARVHAVKNLKTLCTRCHKRLRRRRKSSV